MYTTIDPRLLVTFIHAAHSGSLSATAVQVGRTQSAVTMQMQRLEELIGQALLHRSGSGVRLTGSGERFLAYAERILRLQDEALLSCSDKGLQGTIIFGSPEDYLFAFFAEILRSFGPLYPNVEIKVISAPTVELKALINARQLDLALISTPNATDSQEVLRPEPLVWVGSRPTLGDHGFGEIVPLALPASNAMDHRAACDAMTRAGLRYKIAHASNSLAGLIGIARSGLAISVMTKEAVPPDLFIIGAPMPRLSVLGMLIKFSELGPSPAAVAFADHIKRVLPTL
ncbi:MULTISPECIES: LysR family transcriptional regulator [Mesorhizobium]|uniref:LysR family transcriptional regulator n=1 Tax=Mesorhizobium denitrificans TaxID=2294114 RepID=A0A371XI06_9HYPH|nr:MULTISPECIES: LysR family transcriptional regulator [Mesorhizobium]RFC68674.1 LysR family transcriptional regulator [Mesorhizobium denitrificans]